MNISNLEIIKNNLRKIIPYTILYSILLLFIINNLFVTLIISFILRSMLVIKAEKINTYYNNNIDNSPIEKDSFYNKIENQFKNSNNINKKYKELAKIYHPDLGGDEDQMKTINKVYNKFKKGGI